MSDNNTEDCDLIALAERCEAATGPDRFLAREVLIACGQGYVSPLYRWLDPTASLDAAMTLVPEGWQYCVVNCGGAGQPKPVEGRGTGILWPIGAVSDGEPVEAATPALALTAACLKARATLKSEEKL